MLLAVVIGYVIRRFMVEEMVSVIRGFPRARLLCVVVGPAAVLAAVGLTGPGLAAAAGGRLSQGSTSGSQLRQLSSIRAPVGAAAFGARVAATRDVIVVGTVWRSRRRLGAYVYVRRSDGSFGRSPTARLTVNFRGADDLQSVAISGNTIVIGDPLADVGANAGQGAAYVFARPKGGWHSELQTAVLTAGTTGTRFGWAVGVSANTIVATSDQTLADGPGAGLSVSYVYQKPAGGWRSTKPVASLTAAGNSGTSAGVSVAINATTIAVGQPLAGKIDVYARPSGGWRSTGPSAVLTSRSDPARDEVGQTVAMNANTIAASTLIRGRHPGYRYSAIDVFTRPANGWRSRHPSATLTARHQNEGDDFGFSLAMSSSMILAGGPDGKVDGEESGSAYVLTAQPAAGATSTRASGYPRLGRDPAAGSGTRSRSPARTTSSAHPRSIADRGPPTCSVTELANAPTHGERLPNSAGRLWCTDDLLAASLPACHPLGSRITGVLFRAAVDLKQKCGLAGAEHVRRLRLRWSSTLAWCPVVRLLVSDGPAPVSVLVRARTQCR